MLTKQSFKQRFWKTAKWFIVVFVVLFIFRFTYGYFLPGTAQSDNDAGSFFSSVDNLRKNYASEKFKSGNLLQQPDMAVSQKYEKTATVKSKTAEFAKDAKEIKTKAASYDGVIQYEQNTGNKGNREMHLLIGVNPARFDSFYTAIQHIGTIKSTAITKIDKTNEYRTLNAKKASFEKTLLSLNELKSRNGQIGDYVSLHDKILAIETQMQELGVELGNFDTENEFCTVKFSLYEGATEKGITIFSRVKTALEWTIRYYAMLVFALSVVLVSIFVLLLIAEKLQVAKIISNRID